jgi:hypothetical protein
MRLSSQRKAGLSTLDWAEIDLDSEAYVLRANVISSLPKLIPGKLQAVKDYQDMGVLTPNQTIRLLQNPDLDSVLDPMMASLDLIYKQIDNILDHGGARIRSPRPTPRPKPST